jgi:hypothetical protein
MLIFILTEHYRLRMLAAMLIFILTEHNRLGLLAAMLIFILTEHNRLGMLAVLHLKLFNTTYLDILLMQIQTCGADDAGIVA